MSNSDDSNLQAMEQTSIDTEFTECINTLFVKEKSETQISGRQKNQGTEVGEMSKAETEKIGGEIRTNYKSPQDNLASWKIQLETACREGTGCKEQIRRNGITKEVGRSLNIICQSCKIL